MFLGSLCPVFGSIQSWKQSDLSEVRLAEVKKKSGETAVLIESCLSNDRQKGDITSPSVTSLSLQCFSCEKQGKSGSQ